MTGHSTRWTFYGFETAAGGRPVQEWFDGLSDEERDETIDTIAYLEHLPIDRWKYPRFEHLGGGLSEIRFKVSSLNLTVRIYGFFGPAGRRRAYTLLAGGNKKVKNDKHGKGEAERRMRLLQSGEADVHEFEFSKESNRATAKGKAKPFTTC